VPVPGRRDPLPAPPRRDHPVNAPNEPAMTGPDGLAHPTWCLRDGCETRGWHASRRLVVELTGNTGTTASVRLVQLVVGDAEPHITMAAGDDDAVALLFTIRQARILRRFLARLVELADR
jgi:hypothetical protein